MTARMKTVSVLAASLAILASGCSSNGGPSGLQADLGVSLDCSKPLRPGDEIALEKGLYSAGFDVLNRARLARELRAEFSPPVMIDAIDPQGRMVSVTGFSPPDVDPNWNTSFFLAVSLYSHPPTVRDAKLEATLRSLASSVPACSIRKIERHRNPASIEWLYIDTAKTTRGWFGQAEREAPASDARRVH